jgi:hypothetical protein
MIMRDPRRSWRNSLAAEFVGEPQDIRSVAPRNGEGVGAAKTVTGANEGRPAFTAAPLTETETTPTETT